MFLNMPLPTGMGSWVTDLLAHVSRQGLGRFLLLFLERLLGECVLGLGYINIGLYGFADFRRSGKLRVDNRWLTAIGGIRGYLGIREFAKFHLLCR